MPEICLAEGSFYFKIVIFKFLFEAFDGRYHCYKMSSACDHALKELNGI
jgi:hypothetical protein